MAELNYYNLYSYAVKDFQSATDDKILVDLKKLDSLEYYDEILQFITNTFGEVNGDKELEFPNEVKLLLHKEEDMVFAYASQKEKRIYGKCWHKPKEE